MARNNALNFNLPSVDDLFSTEESRAEARLEKVVNLNPSEISDFPDHPFKVRMDAAMQEMAESVKQYGVLVPALVRPKQGGGYEMVAGHRRKMAAELAQLPEIPCIVRNLTDDEATIIMVDSNLQREQILPSEKAFAYKMKLDAMKRQGQRTDLTSDPVGWKLNGKESAGIVGKEGGDMLRAIPLAGKPCLRQYLCARTSMQPISTEHLSGMGTMRPLRKMARLSIFLWQNMMSIMVPSGHGVLTTVSMMPMRKLDGARSRSAMFFRSRHQMTNGSLSGALPAIIMAAAMWFLGKMMF